MKTDTYTKIVLTVIALALTINTLQDFDFITKAYANETSAFAPMQVEIVSVDLKSSYNDALPIKTDDYLMTDLRLIGGRPAAFGALENSAVLITDDRSNYK